MRLGGWGASLLLVAAIVAAPAYAIAPASLPGDADCDGLVTRGDIDQLSAELVDGDGQSVVDVDGGTVVSCRGVDANGDGAVTAADISALTRLVYGEDGSLGPIVTFIGIASADGTMTMPVGDMPAPIFQALAGIGFRLVIEAAPGRSGLPVGQNLVNGTPGDPTGPPDLQALVSRNLGDGNLAVCGEGGVPGIAPPHFGPLPAITNALKDLACRFDAVSNPAASCTLDAFGAQRFVNPASRTQFCLPVSSVEGFQDGATQVTARVRDIAGNVGPVAQMFLRVGDAPLPTLTPRPTATTSATATLTAAATLEPTETAAPTGTAVPTATPTPPPADTPTGTRVATATATPSA
ncbi:MAG: hypothetical protein ACRDUX_26835, partial [Mycobacterium sp.]